MKIYSLAFLLLVNLISFSQINTVRDGSIEFNDTIRYCVEFEVEAAPKEIEGEWKKFLKKNYKIKAKKYVGDFYMAQDVIYNKVSNQNIDLKFTSYVKDTTTVLQIFVQFKNGNYMNPTDQSIEINRLKGEVKSFLEKFINDYYDSVLKPLLKKQKKIKKDLSKTQKDIDNANKNIKKNQNNIKKNEDKVDDYKSKIEKYNKKIEELNDDIENNTKENEKLLEENTAHDEEVKASKTEKEKIKNELNSVISEINKVQNKK